MSATEQEARVSVIGQSGVPIFTFHGGRASLLIGIAASFTEDELEAAKNEQDAFLLCEKKREQMRKTLDQTTRDLFRHLDEARAVIPPSIKVSFPPLAMEGFTK